MTTLIARFKILAAKRLLGENYGVWNKGGGNEPLRFKRRIETSFPPRIVSLFPKN